MSKYTDAIKHFEGLQKRYTTQHNGTQCEFVKTALSALREAEQRKKGCVWCKEDNKVFHDGQHFHFFCSYCGKRLEVEP